MSSVQSRRGMPQSILSLDRSEDPFAIQLAQACSILDIHLVEPWKASEVSTCEPVVQRPTNFDPRVEWALRWLLKKLQQTDLAPGSPHLKPKAWALLRELAVRAPLTKASRLLSAHRFTKVLRDTLGWLQAQVNCVAVSPDLGVTNEESFDPSEESPGTVESSSSDKKTSKKRKLDGTEVTVSKEALRTTIGTLRVLYLAIYDTVRQLLLLTTDPDQIQGYAVEHMKSSLRSSPEDAAHILGSSFFLTNRMIQTPQRRGHQSKIFSSRFERLLANTGYKCCLLPAIDLWNRRLLKGQHSDTSNNSAFMAACLLPALRLLDTCRQHTTPNEEMAEVVNPIEELLIGHVVLPLRNSILHPGPATEIEDGVSFISFSNRMVSLLRQGLPHLETPSLRADWKTDKHLALLTLSLLFHVAIKHYPRNTPKLRKLETPWLERLFLELAKCAETLFPPISPTRAKKDYIRGIEWMLRKAVDYRLQLSVSAIEPLLDQASGLFRTHRDSHTKSHIGVEDNNQVEWGLVSLCLLTESDAFVIPSSSGNDNETYAYRPPNKYLSALLRNMTEQVCYKSLEKDNDYDFKLLHVIQPLCNAFLGARDLTGFLEHWREQLSIVQEGKESQRKHFASVPSIWEDERLLVYVAQSLESSLTAGQISRVLSTAAHAVTSSIPNLHSDKAISLASLMMLDCVSTGLFKDETLSKLESTAMSVFSLLGALVSKPSQSSSPQGWRVWKVMATITDRWPSLHDSSEFKRKAHVAICMASELIKRISSELKLDDHVDLTQELYAVKFLFKFAAMEDSYWEDLQFSSRRRILSAVIKILDIMEPFCYRISHDLFGTMLHLEDASKGKKSLLKISPVDKFYFECIDEVIGSPDILSHLDGGSQSRLVEQLYWSAVFQQRFLGPKKDPSLDYSLHWKTLLRYDLLDECASMTRCLRNFQVDRFLSTSDFDEPKYWDVGALEYLVVLRSIQETPINSFDRGQRSKLANRVLRILLLANMSKLARTTDHLILLTKLIQIPNKSINVLTNEKETPRKGSAQLGNETVLISLARGFDGVAGSSEDNVQSIRALRRLARTVMEYLFSKLDQNSSIQYLQAFYEQIARSLEHHYRKETPCTLTFSALFEVSLTLFSHRRDDLPESVRPVALDTIRQYHLDIVLKSLDGLKAIDFSKAEQRHICAIGLECLAGYADLLVIHPNLQGLTSQLFSRDGLLQTLTSLDHNDESEKVAKAHKGSSRIEYLAVCLAKVKLRLYGHDCNLDPNLVHVSELFKGLHSQRERDRLIENFMDAMPNLGLQSKKELCFDFQVDQKEYLDYSQLLRVQVGIFSLNDQQIDELRDDLARLVVLLCRGLFEKIGFPECMLSMQCLNMLLRDHPRVISQWHIDQLLAAITVKASTLSGHTEKNSSRLYIGLCRLFGTILAVHRTKIGGRYHLVLPALQALLRCLFVPYEENEAIETESSVLGESHAAAYSRILTAICDPTVSSVSRSRNRSRLELNDERKKARSRVGQHLGYLIMEFCSCQLTGRLLPGMRKALNAGLYAVCAVIPSEMMQTVNAAMDANSRSVFKALYHDYRGSGNWNGG